MLTPRISIVTAILFAFGFGMALYYGNQWYKLPEYSPADLEASIELNLALDLQRRPKANEMSAAEVSAQREKIRAEVTANVEKERDDIRKAFIYGVLMTAFALMQLIFLRRFKQQ